MRAFILFCLFGAAFSKPQGYNYNQQQQSFQVKLPNILTSSGTSSSSSSRTSVQQQSNSIAQESHSFLQQALQNPKVTQSLLSAPQSSYIPPAVPAAPQSSYIPPAVPAVPLPAAQPNYYQPQPAQSAPSAFRGFQPSFGVQQPSFGFQQQQYYQPQYQQQVGSPVVTKDIYVHVAPEEPEDRYRHVAPLPPPPPRKHYRIVFIKAPSPTVTKTAVRVNQAPTEEKTIIYVLTRKPDPLDLEAALQPAEPKQPSKPEVYFIKYRTQEEAQHAQRTIQAQYDQLGGTTQVSDEGVAPVTSVIGSLDQGNAGNSGSAELATSGAGALDIRSGGNSFASSSSSSGSSSNSISFSSGGSSFTSGDSSSASKYLPPIKRQ